MYRYLTLVIAFITGFVTAAWATPKASPIIVKFIRVEKETISEQVEALGNIKAINSITITPNITEKVTQIYFTDGQTVKKGDVLIDLNQAEEQAQLRSAEAILIEAQAVFDRAQGLAKTRDISEAAMQERKTNLLEAEARVNELKARLRDLQIVAPFDGIIGLSDVSLGALVAPGDRIATLDDSSTLRVDFDVPATFVSRIKPGQTAVGTVGAFPDKIFSGQVTSTDSRVDPETRSFVVRAVIENADLLLKPGMLMTVTVRYNTRKVVVIPAKTILSVGQKTFVFVLDKSTKKVTRKEVQLGYRMTDRVEVLSGLSENEYIISEGQFKLQGGAVVNPSLEKNPYGKSVDNQAIRNANGGV